MHTLRIGRVKELNGWALAALAVVLIASVIGLAGLRGHSHLGMQSPAPAPVYVSNVSSMIGTADGTLLEGGSVGSSATPVTQPGHQAAGWLLIGLSVLGLSVVILSGAALYNKLCRRLT